MIVPRINQLPILLFLLTSTHANANIQEFGLGTNPASDSPQDLYRREFTQEKPDQWDEYADSNITECISRCHKALQAGIDVGTNYLPLCAWTDQIYATYNEDIKNINHCQCSDRKYQAQKFECVVKKVCCSCANNSTLNSAIFRLVLY